MSEAVPHAIFELHMARSLFIDNFNKVDSAIRDKLKALGGEPLVLTGQNLDALSKISAGPNYSKAAKQRIVQLISEMKDLQSVRCDVVHGSMEPVKVSDGLVALFSNVQSAPPIGRRCLVLTIAELDQCSAKFETLAKSIREAPLR